MGGVVSGLFGGSGKQETEVKLPGYLEEGAKDVRRLGMQASQQPYVPYTGTRVAERTPLEMQASRKASEGYAEPRSNLRAAYDAAADIQIPTDYGTGTGIKKAFGAVEDVDFAGLAPNYSKALRQTDEARRMAESVGKSKWNQRVSQRYMNPFIESALDPTIRRINEEAQQNAIASRAQQIGQGGAGAFGDARTAMLEGQIEEARLRGVGDTMATGMASAYDRALAAYEAEQARRLSSSGQMGALAGQRASIRGQRFSNELAERQAELQRAGLMGEIASRRADMSRQGVADQLARSDLMGTQAGREAAVTGQQINDLLKTGTIARDIKQRNLDADYASYLEERDWNLRGLNAYIAALSGIPVAQTQTTTGAGPSVLQQVGGLGLAGLGAWQMFSDSSVTPSGSGTSSSGASLGGGAFGTFGGGGSTGSSGGGSALGSTASGAASGAAAGAPFGPYGAAIGGVAGAGLGYLGHRTSS